MNQLPTVNGTLSTNTTNTKTLGKRSLFPQLYKKVKKCDGKKINTDFNISNPLINGSNTTNSTVSRNPSCTTQLHLTTVSYIFIAGFLPIVVLCYLLKCFAGKTNNQSRVHPNSRGANPI